MNLSSLRIGAGIFKAALIKQWKLGRRYQGVFVTLFEAVIGLLVFIYAYFAVLGTYEIPLKYRPFFLTSDIIGFLVIGRIVYGLTFSTVWSTGRSLDYEQMAGTIESLIATPANLFTIISGYGWANMLLNWWLLIIPVIGMIFFDSKINLANWPLILLTTFLMLICLVGIGVCLSGIYIMARAASFLAHVLQQPFHFFTGINFPVQLLPTLLQIISYAIPVTYALFVLRKCMLLQIGPAEIFPDLLMLAFVAALTNILAYFFLKFAVKHAKKTGNISLF